mmetsp:Transcript_19370/g.31730  ORF Transcript_19370/g.31730 Transcript_19370/m.31730 type:complete len:740 (-) Transcript_19370:1150-3369(-)
MSFRTSTGGAKSRPTAPVRMTLAIAQCPKQDLALSNMVFADKDDFSFLASEERGYVILNGYVFTILANAVVTRGTLALNGVQRRLARASLGDQVTVESYNPTQGLASMTLEVDLNTKVKGSAFEIDHDAFAQSFMSKFRFQVFCVGQEVIMDYQGTNLLAKVAAIDPSISLPGAPTEPASKTHGALLTETEITATKVPNGGVRVSGQKKANVSLIRPDWNFESMGIGGLDKEFTDIFRRAFASRIFPPHIIKKLGINHVKGMLLYGPPGTGKTLIARQIGKMLNGKEPKVVNGPEILNKYVGASEENIRKLFIEAEADQKSNGDDAELHIIIFDEIDAVCKSRGSQRDGTGVHDTVVNQLLSKIDGVDALNNILVIGMTNRKDMIDEALLRPGRLEVHMEIGLPDEGGRVQILRIHTLKMRNNKYLAEDVDLLELATLTKNFSGAEIEGLTKSAASFALQRKVDVNNLKGPIDVEHVMVNREDFMAALNEVKPAYGVETDELENRLTYGLISYGPKFDHLRESIRLFIQQVRTSERTPLLSVLLEGGSGAGKTALASKAAIESEFPFVKLLSPENMVGYSELSKCNILNKAFDDASKSPLSVIVLDNIERLMEYVNIGPRFSNLVLQTILVLVKKNPPKGKKLLIIGTTSSASVLDQMEITSAFNVTLNVPTLGPEEIRSVLTELNAFENGDIDRVVNALANTELGIKKLLLVTEMARQEGAKYISYKRFLECLHDSGI